ncbi:MAG: InlB B-repeat-containing protein [Methanomassiliicoccaceae archaeon]|nr:InlB B-repeat-containing protein [Methanomassiliicoccaceae archaeon]
MRTTTKTFVFLSLCLAASVLFASAFISPEGTDNGYMALESGVNNNQGEYSAYTYTFNFAFEGTDAESILWDFGFNDSDGFPVRSTEWNPNMTFPAKGTYIVTQIVTNTVGSFVSTLTVIVLGTPEVVFDSNGGSAVTMQYVKVGFDATEPADPVREGHTFAGWYSDSELATAYDFDTPVSEHTTLYAKWTSDPGTGGEENGNGKKFPLIPVVLGLAGLLLLGAACFTSKGNKDGNKGNRSEKSEKNKKSEEKKAMRLAIGGILLIVAAVSLYMVGVTDLDSLFLLLETGAAT